MGKICYGKYSMGKIMLDIGNNAFDSSSTKLHEAVHAILSSTSWGFTDCLLGILLDEQTIEQKSNLASLRRLFFYGSIEVQESVAVFLELDYVRRHNSEKFDALSRDYQQNNEKYYIQYGYRKLEGFQGQENAPVAIMNLAIAAMNIRLPDLPSGENRIQLLQKADELQYNPNKRFWTAIEYIKDKNIPIEKYSDSEQIKDLFKNAGIFYFDEMSFQELYEWAQKEMIDRFCPGRRTEEFIQVFEGPLEEGIRKQMQATVSFQSDIKYRFEECSYGEFKDKLEVREELIWLTQGRNNKNYNVYVDTYYGCFFIYPDENLDYITDVENHPIFFDRNHYTFYMERCRALKDKFKIIDIAGLDVSGEKFLNEKSSRKMFGIKVNEASIVLFFVGNDKNELLTQALPFETFVTLWCKGILRDYEWIVPEEVYHSGKISGYCIEYVDFLCQNIGDFDSDAKNEKIEWVHIE